MTYSSFVGLHRRLLVGASVSALTAFGLSQSTLAATLLSEVVPGFGTIGLSGVACCSVMVDGADD